MVTERCWVCVRGAESGRSGLRYDVAPDGRFLMLKDQAPSADVAANVSLIVNWVADLRHNPR
jgi:hypothetical protein